jgi:hypothetical protein
MLVLSTEYRIIRFMALNRERAGLLAAPDSLPETAPPKSAPRKKPRRAARLACSKRRKAQKGAAGLDSLCSSGLIWAQKEHPIVIDNTGAKPVKPARAAYRSSDSAKTLKPTGIDFQSENCARKYNVRRPYPVLLEARPFVCQSRA